MRGSLPPSPGELPVLADPVPRDAWVTDLVAASVEFLAGRAGPVAVRRPAVA